MDRRVKLNVLRQLAMSMGDPMMGAFLSFLAGRLDRVHFVESHSGGAVRVTLSPGARLWPRVPFRAEIDGKPVPHPIAFIEAMALRDDDTFVKVDFGAMEAPAWYREAVSDGALDSRSQLEASIERIRRQIDLALDAYRTANEALGGAGEEERQYLRFVLEKAKSELRTLNAQLSSLETKLGSLE